VNDARALYLAGFALRDPFFAVDAIVVEDEKANRRRQITVTAIGIDGRHEIRESYLSATCDFLQSLPERVFQTHTGLMARNYN